MRFEQFWIKRGRNWCCLGVSLVRLCVLVSWICNKKHQFLSFFFNCSNLTSISYRTVSYKNGLSVSDNNLNKHTIVLCSIVLNAKISCQINFLKGGTKCMVMLCISTWIFTAFLLLFLLHLLPCWILKKIAWKGSITTFTTIYR